MANTIILKKSSTASSVPAAGSLQPGELAVNLADKKLYTKTTGGTVILLADGNAAASAGTVTSVNVAGGTTGLTFSGGPVTTSGTITMAGTLAVANGGTGSTTAAGARTNLGLVIGTNVQAWDGDLDAIAALAGTSGLLKKTAANTWSLDTSVYLTANQTITLSGDATGSGSTAITVTLANSGVTAGTYTKVTVDAKGRVTTGASLASGDLPTYTGTLTSSQVTTALGYTPYNSTNPSGYITSSGSITGSAGSLSNNTSYMVYRGSVAQASIDTATSNGFYTQTNPSDSQAVLVFDAGGSVGPFQMRVSYGGTLEFRNKTDSATWTAWKTALTSLNYNNYAPTLTGTGASGTWGISVTGNAATATTLATARTINGTSFNGSANITTASWGTSRTLSFTGDVTGSSSVDGSANVATSMTLANSGVTAGSYTSANITVDAKGRITAASSGSSVVQYPQNAQSGNYTLVIGDAGKHIYCTNTSLQTITFPTNSSVAFPVGATIRLINIGTGNAVIGATGITLYKTGSTTAVSGSYMVPPGGSTTFTKVATDSWWVDGSFEPNLYTASYLVVAGGGSGSGSAGGGGGAGGMLTGTSSLSPGTTYTVTVGGGGSVNANGSNSSALSVTAIGGGFGSDGGGPTGNAGGSGGGGGWVNQAGGAGTAGQGNNGGSGNYYYNGAFYVAGGGGGGRSAAGANAAAGAIYAYGGNGGAGLASSITGSSVTYAGGGGGCGTTVVGAGGAGGGGNGGLNGGAGTDGAANTGGGGGGGWVSKAGGSGVVIISVPTANYSGVHTGSPTVTTSGSNTILKFTSSGSYTA